MENLAEFIHSKAIWYHIVRAQIGVTYKSTVNTRTHALRIRGADHPEADTKVPRLYKDLTTCGNSLTELRIFTFIMDNTGLKGMLWQLCVECTVSLVWSGYTSKITGILGHDQTH
ncbi:hypothetical protein AOL_s00140g28 [Orbilia oligospora ATCC 24927]|uniref:Uncharacterized protein n=1 Tax=Arthrobotrys oligospora (strain ATCC 24927 / CBS 115.81 / DSM 1491) TaxID=756982 RepID=G1XM59_ARTOA|nr:hypothetical protein AOL_s00140g28 [Orbilia oligospora ATCC 24927]EGX45712.1 hypothetical protein AOL_s00140g28 [Orbilia oligospora ATCC 24927]